MTKPSRAVSGVNRRIFIGGLGVAAGIKAAGRSAVATPGPSEQINLAMIGVGGHGFGRLKEFLKHKDVRIATICDLDQRHVDRAIQEVSQVRGAKPKGEKDFRRVLEDPEIDAVAIITPDHWHAIPTVQACEAGKDVFVEKPLSYSVAEGRAMVDAAVKFKRVTQMGNHIHNDLPNYRRVVERVRSGTLGKITRVQCWKTTPRFNWGFPSDEPVPTGVDYDMWLGPAPTRPFNKLRFHNSFRHFWDYSGGSALDFYCHIADVAFWALDLKAPKSVSAVGGRYLVQDATETPDCLEAVMEFPGLTFIYTFHPLVPTGLERFGGIGCVFQGTEATLVTNYDKHEVLVNGAPVPDFPTPARSIPDSPGHIREFLDAVKSRNLDTTCNIRYGHQLTKPALLANLAYRTGERIYWDDAKEDIVGDSTARSMLSRVFRKPWSL